MFLGLFWRIHMVDLTIAGVFFVLLSLLSTYMMEIAYRNTKFALKHKISSKREEGVSREMGKLLADDKKMSRKEKDERILWKKNEVADFEATAFSIFYNNAIYLAILVTVSFFILRSSSPIVNYLFSVGGSSSLLALLSTSKPN